MNDLTVQKSISNRGLESNLVSITNENSDSITNRTCQAIPIFIIPTRVGHTAIHGIKTRQLTAEIYDTITEMEGKAPGLPTYLGHTPFIISYPISIKPAYLRAPSKKRVLYTFSLRKRTGGHPRTSFLINIPINPYNITKASETDLKQLFPGTFIYQFKKKVENRDLRARLGEVVIDCGNRGKK